jgi:hypothetical protein
MVAFRRRSRIKASHSAADGYIGFHHGRRLCHAEVNEVLKPSFCCCLDRSFACNQIDAAKLCALSWTGMCDTHQLHKSVRGRNLREIGALIEGVSDNRSATTWQLKFRSGPDECPDLVASLEQPRNQFAAYVAGATSHENGS